MADNLADMKKRCLPNKKYLSGKNHLGTIGAGDGGRTHTVSPPTDFESVSSANSNTPAWMITVILYGKLLQKSSGKLSIKNKTHEIVQVAKKIAG